MQTIIAPVAVFLGAPLLAAFFSPDARDAHEVAGRLRHGATPLAQLFGHPRDAVRQDEHRHSRHNRKPDGGRMAGGWPTRRKWTRGSSFNSEAASMTLPSALATP